jgi:hypothetical protein
MAVSLGVIVVVLMRGNSRGREEDGRPQDGLEGGELHFDRRG